MRLAGIPVARPQRHPDPGGTAARVVRRALHTGGAGGGAPLGNRVPLGSGHRNSGNAALRQKFSGSMPRFLKAASTHGCEIWYGRRLCRTTLKNGPEAMASFSDGRNLPTSVKPLARSSLR